VYVERSERGGIGMIVGMGEGCECSRLGVGLADVFDASRDGLSSFRGAGFAPRKDGCFREMTGDDAEREVLPGRPFTRAPGVALTTFMPFGFPVIASPEVNDVWPLSFGSAACECSFTAARPPGTLSPNPLARGGMSSSRGVAGRRGIEPGDDVSACSSPGESFNIFGVSALIVLGDVGALLFRLAMS
jgi:hypothetical protein